jgi:hypothetical protein
VNESDDEEEEEEESGVLIQGNDTYICNEYSLKFLQVFTKATKLSFDLKIQMKKDYPIILNYYIPNLGLLRFCLAPTNEVQQVPKPTKKLKNLEERQNQYLTQQLSIDTEIPPVGLLITEEEEEAQAKEKKIKQKMIKRVRSMEKQLSTKKRKTSPKQGHHQVATILEPAINADFDDDF